MARMTVSLPDSMLSKVDEQANGLRIPRSQYVLEALDFYATEQIKLKADIDELNSQIIVKDKELESKINEILKLQETVHALEIQLAETTKAKSAVDNLLAEAEQCKAKLEQANAETSQLKFQLDQTQKKLEQSSTEASNIKDELEQLRTKYNQTTVEDTKRWEELKGVKSENTKLKKDLDAAQATTQRLQAELLNKQTEVDRIAALREELATTKTDRERLQEALKTRDEDVAFLRGHVSQLTQTVNQLALPPSEEEAKKKGWWQFWK